MDNREIDFKYLYPNLIIFLGQNKNETLLKQLQKSFNEFQYGPIFKKEEKCYKQELGRQVSVCRLMQGNGVPVCLAVGEGDQNCDAEQDAVERLFSKLCDSCYVIKANPEYFKKNKKIITHFALNADPSQSHIYKVVYLKTNARGVCFPHKVSGAVDYVENYDELTAYIETYVKSGTKADLFILNVLKADRARIKQLCVPHGLQIQFLVGCSDMGIYIFRNMSTHLILQSLLKDGGRNVKYKLIGPRDKYGDNEDKVDQNLVKAEAGLVQPKGPSEVDGEIVISDWIANHLVLMEVVSEWNELECTREIIWRSVHHCPDTLEFIVEKIRNTAGMIHADAMIDRNVVGRARGFTEKVVKANAAENALENLKKYCYYIQIKPSYFGSSQALPYFLNQPDPNPDTRMYRIADKEIGPPSKILKRFKGTGQEDLYFLHSFSEAERKQIEMLAKGRGFLVRWIGKESYLCVYKQKKPSFVLHELLLTPCLENEKYKLIVPQSKLHYHQDGSYNQGQEFHNDPSAPDTSDHPSWYVDQEAEEATEEESDETPNWVTDYIKSTPEKPVKRPTQSLRNRDDVYSRYKFVSPKLYPAQGSASSVNMQRADQRPNQNVTSGNVHPSKDTGHGSTLSGRFQLLLEEQNRSNIQNQQEPSNGSYKRPYDQESDFKEEPREKIFKPTTNPHISQYNSSFGRQSSRGEGEPSNSYREGRMSDLSGQNPRAGYSSGLEDWSRTGDPSFKEENGSRNNMYTSDTQLNAYQCKNPYDERTSVKEEYRSEMDSSRLFDRRPESSQFNNSQWGQGTNQQYDARPGPSTGGQHDVSNLFDFSGPQDFSKPMFPPPKPRKLQLRRSKGYSYSKLEKYGRGKKY